LQKNKFKKKERKNDFGFSIFKKGTVNTGEVKTNSFFAFMTVPDELTML